MLFRYRITLDVDVEFEAPLLGVDTTKVKRKIVNSIAKKTLQEMISLESTTVNVNRQVDEENLKGTVKGNIHLGKSDKNKY